jgi:hypothetical protein
MISRATQNIRLFFKGKPAEEPESPAPKATQPPPLPGVKPIPENLSILDIIREVEAGGVEPVDAIAWSGLAEDIMANADELPPLPSFPAVAGQVMQLVNQPDLDLNELAAIVQRDAAIASTLIRAASSAAYAPAVSPNSVRAAIQALGTRQVIELVVASSGRKFYEIATKAEIAMFPELWRSMFGGATANAFTSARFALDVPGATPDTALLSGLLADLGRPIALRIVARILKGRVDEAVVQAALDEVGPQISARVVADMALPVSLSVDRVEWHVGQLIGAVGAVQRRTLRIWKNAAAVREHAEYIHASPIVVRALFSLRTTYVGQVARMFG